MLFLAMLRDFSFFMPNTNIIGFSFGQLEKMSLIQDLCDGYYLDKTTQPAPSCDRVLCQDIKSFEVLTNIITVGSFANIKCLQINKNTDSINKASEDIALLNSVLCYQKTHFPKRTLRFLNHFANNCKTPKILVDSWNKEDKKVIFATKSSEFYPGTETLTKEERKKSKQKRNSKSRLLDKLNIKGGVKFLKALKGYKTVDEINKLMDDTEK